MHQGTDRYKPRGFVGRWREARRERAADRRALRSEFELERPRGLARLRAFAAEVAALEGERMRTREAAVREGASRREQQPTPTR